MQLRAYFLLGILICLGCQIPSGGSLPEGTELSVRAAWEPLRGKDIETLMAAPYGQELKDFSVHQPMATYTTEELSDFLPPPSARVGDIWDLHPSLVERLLSQLHGSVETAMNFDGSGSKAILRARSEQYLDIEVRIHAQFVFSENLFISPAQFAGRVLYNRGAERVDFLRLQVPTVHARNIGFEVHDHDWLSGLGFAPKILLASSTIWTQDPVWDEEITRSQAQAELAEAFYALRELEWLPLEKALGRGKPAFVIVIEGALDDQSC